MSCAFTFSDGTSYDYLTDRMSKTMQHIVYTEVLDLSPYFATVIERRGIAFAGHYQAYRRVRSSFSEWMLILDQSVVPVPWRDAKRCQASSFSMKQ
jgi:hypothetical protein